MLCGFFWERTRSVYDGCEVVGFWDGLRNEK